MPPFVRTVIDFETYFDQDYTLSKLTTEEYIRDPRFKIHGLGVQIDQERPFYLYRRDDLLHFLKSHPWERSFVVAHHCLPGEVEVLTKQGWRTIAETPVSEEIMQWDPQTTALTWARPTEKIVGHAAELIEWNTSFHRCAYTPEHRMFYHTPNRQEWRAASVEEVSAMSANNVFIPLGGVYTPEHPRAMTPAMARLMEAIRADGSFQHLNGTCYGVRFKLGEQRKIDRVHELFQLAGVTGPACYERRNKDGFIVVGCNTHPKITELFELLTREKVYGKWVLELTPACREAILDEARYWDGHQRKSDKAYMFSTVDPETVEAFEFMAHCTGQSVSGGWHDNNRGFGAGNNRPLWTASVRKRSRAKLVEKPVRRPHNAPVYCFTVPTEAFLIRANGRIIVTGNSHFDGAILSWLAGIRPAFLGCTLSMARALVPWESGSLFNLAKVFGVGEKGIELESVKGKRDLTEQEQQTLGKYCINDIELTAALFDIMRPRLPVSEYRLIDLILRMFTEPVLEVEPTVLVAAYKLERRTKRALVANCVTDKTTLASNDKFAALLLSLGVDPPKKLSPAKVKDKRIDPSAVGDSPPGLLPSFTPKSARQLALKFGRTIPGEIYTAYKAQLKEQKENYPWAYGFGKSDEQFKLLLDHPDPQIAALVEARMGVKSTIKETRSKRFYKIGKRGKFPVYHKFWGAKTGRDCLVGEMEITVCRGAAQLSIRLDELQRDDLVWDGEAFVHHDGLLDRGIKDVMTHDSITGTPDHRVFCRGVIHPLSVAAELELGLDPRSGGNALA